MEWGILSALAAVLQPENLIACLLGCLVGTVVGVLPGIGPFVTMAILLPLTFEAPTTAGMIMLAGIYYGAMYGGSTTSILVNVPGESASVVTCLDGYQMARKGRGGAALAVAALGSFIAGTIGIVALQLFAPPLANAALLFGPPEFFAITLLGLTVLSTLTGRMPLKSQIMACFGIMLATVGMDPLTGMDRFTFDTKPLLHGIGLLPIALGLFGVAEILSAVAEETAGKQVFKIRIRDLYPSREELKKSIAPMFRGGILGFLVGLIPGPAATLSSFVSYGLERRISKHPEEFGKGAIEGVAGPESANNAACAGTLVPLLALGLPFSPPMAILLGGMMMHGLTPGPMLMTNNPEIFWGVVASMYVGNIFLLVLNLPLVGIFARLAMFPAKYMLPIVLVLCMTGAYSENNSLFDVWVVLISGIVGYYLRRFEFDGAPLILGMVLGRVMEGSLRQSLVLMDGNPAGFWNRPISGVLITMAILAMIVPLVIKWITKKEVHGFEG